MDLEVELSKEDIEVLWKALENPLEPNKYLVRAAKCYKNFMNKSGYYPGGADSDTDAPWKQIEVPVSYSITLDIEDFVTTNGRLDIQALTESRIEEIKKDIIEFCEEELGIFIK